MSVRVFINNHVYIYVDSDDDIVASVDACEWHAYENKDACENKDARECDVCENRFARKWDACVGDDCQNLSL